MCKSRESVVVWMEQVFVSVAVTLGCLLGLSLSKMGDDDNLTKIMFVQNTIRQASNCKQGS